MSLVLVVEPDERRADLVRQQLECAGHEVRVVESGDAALRSVAEWTPHLLVLDGVLPDLDGVEVCRTLRERGETVPVLMLSASRAEDDLLRALREGADDFLPTPYNPRELLARLHALLRRAHRFEPRATVFTVGGLDVDVRRRVVLVDGDEVEVTRAEFDLLEELARHADTVLTRSRLLSRLHGSDLYITERTIDTHVKNVRAKIEDDPRHPRRLITVYGQGYRLVAEPAAAPPPAHREPEGHPTPGSKTALSTSRGRSRPD